MLPLSALGDRIMVMGPSNAGKSTLAVALASKLGAPAVHLDQLHHQPNSNWVPRPKAEFIALHNEAILADRWVMEGNYTRLIPQRLERATGAILITSNRWLRLARYFKRTLVNAQDRVGHLEGGKDRITWMMIDWIMFKTPKKFVQSSEILRSSRLPLVECDTVKELKALYREWDLPAPGAAETAGL